MTTKIKDNSDGMNDEYKSTERDHREAALCHATSLLRSEGIISESMEKLLDQIIMNTEPKRGRVTHNNSHGLINVVESKEETNE